MLRAAAILMLLIVSALAALAFDGASDFGAGPARAAVAISVEQTDDAVRVVYSMRRPVRRLAFRSVEGGYRERRWKPLSPEFIIRRGAELDWIERHDGARFKTVALDAFPNFIRIEKNYQPLAVYGDGGFLFYTGHFWPVIDENRRMDAVFSFTPAARAKVVAFGERAGGLVDWRSPMAHPAFVYLGPLQPVETRDVLALVDLSAPAWIQEEFASLTPAVFDKLAALFDFHLDTKPNLFMAAPLGSQPGRLSYSGDALPGQFQITLEGGGWREPSARAVSIFRRATIHEAVHLWQSAARPAAQEEAPWIHEGAADAIAAEAMVALGYWDGEAFEAHENQARTECAERLRGGPLKTAAERKDYRALYACGHVIAMAVSRADGAPTAEFWRAFIEQSRDRNAGYTEKQFYGLVNARTDDPAFERALRAFVRTPHANPENEIDRLFAAAKPPLAPRGAR